MSARQDLSDAEVMHRLQQNDISDAELMRLVQHNDVNAFGELYNRYRARAFGIAQPICRGPQRAEDALQEAFLSVWRSRAAYDPARGSVAAWVLTVVRRRSINVIQKASRCEGLADLVDELDEVAAPGSVADDAETRAEAEAVRGAVRRLPAAQREAIVLAYYAGLTHDEIAAQLQLPLGTVKGRLRLGFSKLADELSATLRPTVGLDNSGPGVPPAIQLGERR